MLFFILIKFAVTNVETTQVLRLFHLGSFLACTLVFTPVGIAESGDCAQRRGVAMSKTALILGMYKNSNNSKCSLSGNTNQQTMQCGRRSSDGHTELQIGAGRRERVVFSLYTEQQESLPFHLTHTQT